jgi:hypothetical protein
MSGMKMKNHLFDFYQTKIVKFREMQILTSLVHCTLFV